MTFENISFDEKSIGCSFNIYPQSWRCRVDCERTTRQSAL
jgi:hypothetical protein